MKVAIAGAGIAGAYLYRRLREHGYMVHLFDRTPKGGCGLTPCAWGTSAAFFDLVAKAGLTPEKYLLRRLDHVWMDEVKVRGDLLTFDKPRLVHDLLQGTAPQAAPVPVDRYDRVIDATGVCRALLPPVEDDIVLECCQYLVETTEPLENRIRLGGIGYAWCFPLTANRYHIGCGSLLHDPRRRLDELGWLRTTSAHYRKRVLCSCAGKIRLTGPHLSQPLTADGCPEGIWGIGEAIGCVAPLAGDGIVPGLRSAELLLDSWADAQRYRRSILGEFRWMEKERAVIDTLRRGRRVGVHHALTLRKNARRMGMRVGLREALALLHRLG